MKTTNTSSWFPLALYAKSAPSGILFGPCLQPEKLSCPYPNEQVKLNETVIWIPKLHKTVSLKAYERAHQTQDQDALSKISSLGIPLGCTFGGCISLAPKSQSLAAAS